ncbi:IS3 family transposase [Actinacidiphila glaucinigra]
MRVFDRLYIGGRWEESAGSETLEVRSPHDHSLVGSTPHAAPADVDRAVAAARQAFERGRWPRMTPEERQDVVSRFAKRHAERAEELAQLVRLCQVLEVARSSFYKWRASRQARAARERADASLAERIRAVHTEWDGTYGRPRITAELRDEGEHVNHKRVGRVMRKYGIAGLRLRKRQVTTVPEPSATPVPDLLGRDFTASAPNMKYVGDITYLPVGDGEFLYLATVIDCFSRRLVGWSVADHMQSHTRLPWVPQPYERLGRPRKKVERTELVADALRAAAATRGSLAGAVFHSDHGTQYTARQFADVCAELGVRRPMGAVGTSADNALAESFNAALKRETLRGARRFDGARACRMAVFRWTTRYNTRRRHSANGQQAPIAYEQQSATLTLAA